jgi:putative endonuclease
MDERLYYVYILASRSRILYVGMTNDLVRRVQEHRDENSETFAGRYRVHRLVHIESSHDVRSAIGREKQIKAWSRAKKIALIEETDPAWEDLVGDLFPRFERKADSSLRSG